MNVRISIPEIGWMKLTKTSISKRKIPHYCLETSKVFFFVSFNLSMTFGNLPWHFSQLSALQAFMTTSPGATIYIDNDLYHCSMHEGTIANSKYLRKLLKSWSWIHIEKDFCAYYYVGNKVSDSWCQMYLSFILIWNHTIL